MARDEDEDLYDEEFDFVDDEEVSEDGEESSADDSDLADEQADEPSEERAIDDTDMDAPDDSETPVDEYGRTEPVANYLVHVYENKKFKRTIDRPFTPEDAEAFATEFNRTAKNYSRVALTGKNDAKPKKALD